MVMFHASASSDYAFHIPTAERGAHTVTGRLMRFGVVGMVCAAIGFLCGIYVGKERGMPFVATQYQWSIGIYAGESPLSLGPSKRVSNPVLTAKDVTDVRAEFVADPFMVRHDSDWYMFFEVMNAETKQGDIGLAVSPDGLSWSYECIVLDEPFHLSYPCVYRWENDYYMIPETTAANSIRLYKADSFPTKWSFVKTILGGYFADTTILNHDGRWWLFSETMPGRHDTLRLYHSDDLMGQFVEHPASPIVVGDPHRARPGGRVLALGDRIIRYAQDDYPAYGNAVRAFEITELTPSSYKEREVTERPILSGTGGGWNADGMHQVDAYQVDTDAWIACVDGWRKTRVFGWEY
jgi:hypothetical protein